MEIELTNGKGLIQICVSKGSYSYLKYQKPLSVVWWDSHGSIGQFLTVSKEDNGFRNILDCYSKDTLYMDFTNNLEEAYIFIKPLLELFENGKYEISFTTASVEKPNDNPFDYWSLHIPYGLDTQNSAEQIKKHKEFLLENEVSKKYYPSNLLDFSTYNFSDYVGASFVATQPKDSIDLKQVEVYKNEIISGQRPFAIVASKVVGTGQTQEYSPSFVLDGHHKILAYEELKMNPAVLSITSVSDKINDLKFNLDEVKDAMFPWQYEHLSKHYDWYK
jgi:hypothetical protein